MLRSLNDDKKLCVYFYVMCFMAIVGKYIHIFICIYELQEGYIPRKT